MSNKFFEEYNYTIQGISNIIQAATIIVLVLVTIWYAESTYKMYNVMRSDYELSNRPIFSIDRVDIIQEENKIIFKIVVQNRGKVPAKIIKFEKSIPGIQVPIDGILGDPIIYPGEIRFLEIGSATGDKIFKKIDILIKIAYTNIFDINGKTYCIDYYMNYEGDPNGNIKIIDSKICEKKL